MTRDLLQTYCENLADLETRTLAKMRETAREFAGDDALPPDMIDRACLESERNFALILRERDRQTLAGIRQAISRLEAGGYGVCDECGEDIAPARLKAHPMATLCVHCQDLREQGERRLRSSAAPECFLV